MFTHPNYVIHFFSTLLCFVVIMLMGGKDLLDVTNSNTNTHTNDLSYLPCSTVFWVQKLYRAFRMLHISKKQQHNVLLLQIKAIMFNQCGQITFVSAILKFLFIFWLLGNFML